MYKKAAVSAAFLFSASMFVISRLKTHEFLHQNVWNLSVLV